MKTRIVSVVSALAIGLGTPVLLASSASANITSPGNGAVLRGNATLSASGASDGTLCANATSPNTTLSLINSGGTTVFSNNQGGTGAKSVTIDTHNYPNGAYTARAAEQKRSGFIFCSNSTTTTNASVTIDNISQIATAGATEGAQNTSVTVSATLTDPNLASSVLPGQTVSFNLSGGGSVNAVTNASGVATASLPVAGPPRSATLTTSFAGTAYFAGSSKQVAFDVKKNASTTTVVQPATVVFGQPTSFSAQVARVDGSSTPSGTVQFTVDGSNFGAPAPVSGGVASSGSISTLATGNHTIGAIYSGDSNLGGSTAATKTQVVDKAPTSTVLTSTGSPTVSGEAVTFTATVDVVAPGAGSPAGGVQFDIDGAPYGTAVQLNGNQATLTVSNLAAGNHDVTATYNGNGDFASSSSATLTHGVNRADTTLTLSTSNADEAVAGEPLVFTADVAIVAPGSGTLTGDVQFFADGDPIGSPVAVNNGVAVSAPIGLDAGDHVITANYEGDSRFAGATDSLDQEVAPGHTSTTVTTSPSPSVVGQNVTIHAEVAPVAPATGTPEGIAQIYVDGNSVAFVDLVDGAAEFSTSTLARGTHTVKVRYLSADPNFLTSTSPLIDHTVNKASTTTSVVTSATPSVFGQSVTFTATVSVNAPGAGNPSGTVTFTDGQTVLGSASVSSATGGIASIATDALGVGQHAIVATYDGDDSFNGSTGSVSQKVQRAQTSTVVTSSANPAQSGQSIRFTAAVSPVAPGAGVPSGTVRFTVNGANLGSPVALVDGVATSAAFSSLSPGTYRIEATYSGDARFVNSGGVLDQGAGQAVAKGATTLGLVSDDDNANHGQTVTWTATVSAVAPATGKPTGVVQFWNGGVLLGATSLVPGSGNSSAASYSSNVLSPGTHTVRAVYVGNFNFDSSLAQIDQVVGVAGTVTGVASSANPATYGGAVTFTATVANLAAGSPAPTGSVSFYDGTDLLGTAAVATAGAQTTASLAVPDLVAGNHDITAVYGGDGAHAGSGSPVLVQVMQRAQATLVAHDVADAPIDNYSRVEATLTGLGGAPLAGQALVFTTGPLFNGLQNSVCTAVTDANGYAFCNVPLRQGALILYGFEVSFAGNDAYAPAHDETVFEDPED